MKTCPAVHSFVLEVWLWVYTCTQRLRTLSWPLLEICVLKNQWCVTAKCNYAHEQWWQQFSIWRLPLDLLQMTGAAACFHWLGSLPWSEHKWYRNIIKSVLLIPHIYVFPVKTASLSGLTGIYIAVHCNALNPVNTARPGNLRNQHGQWSVWQGVQELTEVVSSLGLAPGILRLKQLG